MNMILHPVTLQMELLPALRLKIYPMIGFVWSVPHPKTSSKRSSEGFSGSGFLAEPESFSVLRDLNLKNKKKMKYPDHDRCLLDVIRHGHGL